MVDKQPFFWIQIDGEEKLATQNLIPGNQVYNERLVQYKGVECRIWNPFRSKLAAAIMNGLDDFPFTQKSDVLYLGVSTGTTISHISDIVGIGGKIFVVKDIMKNTKNFSDEPVNNRTNIFTINYDKNNLEQFSSEIETVDVIYLDITQPNKTEITIDNCKNYLRNDGYLMLVVPTKNIDFAKNPTKENLEGRKRLQSSFDVIQEINLTDFFKEHSMIIAKYLG